jgi:hypothetical protein
MASRYESRCRRGRNSRIQLAEDRRAAQAATDKDPEADFAVVVADQVEADVVRTNHRAIIGRGIDRDLELARQESEFGMEGRPLPQQFAVRARIGHSSGATPAKWSVVMLRTQLPEVCTACISTLASSPRISGVSSNCGQLSCMFWRVVKCPTARS